MSSFIFPRFTAAAIGRYLPEVEASQLTTRERHLWVWTANGFRGRGFELLDCVRAANRSVRNAGRIARRLRVRYPRGGNTKQRAPTIPADRAALLITARWRRRAARLARRSAARRGGGGAGG